MRLLNTITLVGAATLGTVFLFSNSAHSGTTEVTQERQREGGRRREGERDGERKHEEGPAHEAMEGMQSGMRALRKLISDPEQKDACIEILHDMQKGAVSVLEFAPPPAEGIDEAMRLTWKTDFKRRILSLGLKMVDLEEALLKGETEGAQALYKELGALKKESHEKYAPE